MDISRHSHPFPIDVSNPSSFPRAYRAPVGGSGLSTGRPVPFETREPQFGNIGGAGGQVGGADGTRGPLKLTKVDFPPLLFVL